MDASEGRRRPIGDLRGFAQDFVQVCDPRVTVAVARVRARGPRPDSWLSLNPSPSAAARSTTRRDDASDGEYRTKRVDLEMDNAGQTALDTGVPAPPQAPRSMAKARATRALNGRQSHERSLVVVPPWS